MPILQRLPVWRLISLLKYCPLCVAWGCSHEMETKFAPGFTERNFGMVQLGDESNRVVELIGMPLRADHHVFSELWIYGMPPTAQASDDLLTKQGAFPLPRLVLYFGVDGVVQSYSGREGDSFVGKDKNLVKLALGWPEETKTNPALFIFNYSKGNRSGSFDVRAVILSEQGRVLEKKSFYYRD